MLVKSVEMNIFHVNNRSGALCLYQSRRMGYPACIGLILHRWYQNRYSTATLFPRTIAWNLSQFIFKLLSLNYFMAAGVLEVLFSKRHHHNFRHYYHRYNCAGFQVYGIYRQWTYWKMHQDWFMWNTCRNIDPISASIPNFQSLFAIY